jgi:hypothetical protein
MMYLKKINNSKYIFYLIKTIKIISLYILKIKIKIELKIINNQIDEENFFYGELLHNSFFIYNI